MLKCFTAIGCVPIVFSATMSFRMSTKSSSPPKIPMTRGAVPSCKICGGHWGRFSEIVKIGGLDLIFAGFLSVSIAHQNEGYETSRYCGSNDPHPSVLTTMLTLWFVLRLHRLASTIRSKIWQ